ncbi:MAG TPA: M1 family metallopeptidase [Acidimicrobiales bacterium]|nr:M1 family metallopeptidase [Acidimicrobiales bacterium]
MPPTDADARDDRSDDRSDDVRLPRSVLPSRYELELEPDLGTATFRGSVVVDVDVATPTSTVVLNAIELEIDEAWIDVDGERRDATVTLEAVTERASLVFQQELAAGPARLHVVFRGMLNDKLRGFYRSTFTDKAGAERTIATTQFESTDARRAFPCWDEPDFKASYAITLVVPDDQFAISNAAEIGREPAGDGKVRVTFAETMVMSTYLVAFVVGPFEATEPVDAGGVPLRVVTPIGQGHLAPFALEIGEFALRHFTEYFGVPYPGDKVDLVAIPDFAFGAMENLGCITFRETALLIDPARATQPELERVADVVAHELAHMWFGDLVTMKWWNGIWLNEAFATFMETVAVDEFRPEWDRWTTFGLSRTAAYDTDSLGATRAIEYPVHSPDDAEGMFDVLTYEKGCSVVRMLEQYLGAAEFRAGIRDYISTHAYANTETGDLWDALEAATGEPVRRVADSWIFQGGHPEVSVGLSRDGTTIALGQRRFRYLGGDDGERWAVPVLTRIGQADGTTTDRRDLLDGDHLDVRLDQPAAWVVANAGGHGFYRVRYGGDLLARLTGEALTGLSPLERYNLLDDAWAASLAGSTGVGDLVGLLHGFVSEDDVNVWRRIVGILGGLNRICPDASRAAFASLVRELARPAFDRLGPTPREGEPDQDATRRAVLFETLGVLGRDPDVHARARELDALVADDQPTGHLADAALIDAAVRTLAPQGDRARFDSYRARAESATVPQDTLRYLGALTDFEGEDLYDEALALNLTPAVRTQDVGLLVVRALSNRANGPRGWRFVAAHWDELLGRMPGNMAGRLATGTRTFTDRALADEVEAFLDSHPIANAAKATAQHIERMRVSVAFAERGGEALTRALG